LKHNENGLKKKLECVRLFVPGTGKCAPRPLTIPRLLSDFTHKTLIR